jgi:flagellar FliJ protein
MARFDFPLEGILRQRKGVEQERMREMAMAQAQMNRLKEELQALDRSAQEATAELRRDRLIGPLDMGFIAAHRRFTASIQRKAMGLVQRMALAQREINEKRNALAQAAKERKIIEKLKEKQLERWREAQARKEMAEMDEIGMQISYRQGREALLAGKDGDEA